MSSLLCDLTQNVLAHIERKDILCKIAGVNCGLFLWLLAPDRHKVPHATECILLHFNNRLLM